MVAYARWCEESGNFFRDQTILQFGNEWNLIANIVLLNPGSAEPKSDKIINDFLVSKNLPYLEKPTFEQNYYEFKLDPLMRNLLNCFSKKYSGGVIKIYNLFNLKNSNSNDAVNMLDSLDSKYLFNDNVNFLDAPVIFASGSINKDRLKDELIKFYNCAKDNSKYYLAKTENKSFGFKKVQNIDDIFNAYHPSYTFSYGNSTVCENICE
ncbi:hypothetical protein [Hydrogenimonas thermophila]|uniref:Uncharacterized protein n=1 Tax=Hydrogenimonas thermophila TaxID=223786 RepID=A0A1I5V035_9BACT|nr:hypothetical protein [Hydrogenimonas thermophila]WOE71080.1 hypothetical protein RZR91_05775 [Hydrogenimonas thermophila]WOE73598.1 hypothetical protein RZR97_05755 [Hydrogenimonas thermophila]SFQ00697.1 hypothetical protein SAMN05216234_1781 [Hydrogenimonas thermophila]